jgi:hypothetical protein
VIERTWVDTEIVQQQEKGKHKYQKATFPQDDSATKRSRQEGLELAADVSRTFLWANQDRQAEYKTQIECDSP